MEKPDETLAERFLRLHGAGRAEDWIACERIDALLSDRLAGEDILPDPDIEFHVREGLLAIRTARLAPHIFYRLERFDRVLGKISHAIAILDIDQSMTARSEEHTSELQSLMRISYAVFCLQKKKNNKRNT